MLLTQLTVNDQITLQDINLAEPNLVPPLQMLPNVNAIVDEITNNVLTKISQNTLPDLPEPETIVTDTDVDQDSDTEKNNYFEDDYIGEIIPETPDEQQQIPQELLDSLTRIDSTPSSPPQGDELIIIIINYDDDIDSNKSRTTNGGKLEIIIMTMTKS